jgi:hypothetical protein
MQINIVIFEISLRDCDIDSTTGYFVPYCVFHQYRCSSLQFELCVSDDGKSNVVLIGRNVETIIIMNCSIQVWKNRIVREDKT